MAGIHTSKKKMASTNTLVSVTPDQSPNPISKDIGILNCGAVTILLGWYGVSIVTLFVNKHVLATIKFDATALSMIQMSVATLLSVVNLYWSCGMTAADDKDAVKSAAGSIRPRGFYRNMVIVGLFRFLTVYLGLVALKYVPVSFTETVKSSAPIFTVVISSLLLGERNGCYSSLVPIMLGLALCSVYELQFNITGFLAALATNLAECCQFVYSKLLISGTKYKTSPVEFQLFSSIAAICILVPTCIAMVDFHEVFSMLSNDNILLVCTLTSGVAYHFQTMLAWLLMSYVSPVTHSVSNVVKRAMLIWLSVLWFGNPVTALGAVGTFVVIGGVLVYNKAREYEHNIALQKPSNIGPAQTKTI